VVSTPRQGEVWWAESEAGRRPVLIVTRSDAVPVLNRVIVAPVTRTIRAIPTEVALGHEEGLPGDCVAAFDNLVPVSRSLLTQRVGRLSALRRPAICAALAALADC
jgi:mRNA interferase MazF